MNKKWYMCVAVMLAMCFLITPIYSIAASSDASSDAAQEEKHPKYIYRDMFYEMENTKDLSFEAPEIVYNGKKYKAVDAKCKFYSYPVSRTEKILSTNKKAPSYIKRAFHGQEIKYYPPKKIKWKKCVPYQKEYGLDEEIPKKIKKSGKTLVKEGEPRLKQRVENVAAPANFATKDPDSAYYSFNNKIVELIDNQPIWNGYQEDYAVYLGVAKNSNYSITGSYWNGDFVKKDDTYYRQATVTGTKVVSYYEVDYVYPGKTTYEAKVKFTSKMIGLAHVKYTLKWPIIKIIIYACCGIGVLALLISAILGAFKRKRKLVDEDVTPKELYNLKPLDEDEDDVKETEESITDFVNEENTFKEISDIDTSKDIEIDAESDALIEKDVNTDKKSKKKSFTDIITEMYENEYPPEDIKKEDDPYYNL